MLCPMVKRNRLPSCPTMLVAAVATDRDCGEIIFAVTPPEALAATASGGHAHRRSGILLHPAEQGARGGVRPGQEHAEPAKQRREEREQAPRVREGKAERGTHAGIVHQVGEAKDHGDGHDREGQLTQRAHEADGKEILDGFKSAASTELEIVSSPSCNTCTSDTENTHNKGGENNADVP
jgi:hypothetical protein